MKTFWMAALAATLAGFGLAVPHAVAHMEVSVGVEISAEADFYEPLTTHGAWVEVGTYGRCWRPARIEAEWRPYCVGHWVWTDCGWYWESDEPWAWACYHYGRWVYDPVHFWVWVPGVEWGPAWVSWREGGGYVGWAPLPPHVRFRGEVIVADEVRVEPSAFVFVQTGHFLEPVRPRTVIVNNTTIVNKTVNITKIRQENKTIGNNTRRVVVNEGPRADAIERATSKTVRAEPITDVARHAAPPRAVREKATRSTEDVTKPEPRHEKAPAPQERPRVAPRREPAPEVSPSPPAERPAPDRVRPQSPGGEKVKRPPPSEPAPDEEEPREKKKHRKGEDDQETDEPKGRGHGKD